MPSPPQVRTEPGQVIKPDSCKAVDGEGMPLQGHPFEKGNLYIQFSVVFPETLDPQQVRSQGFGLGFRPT